MQKSQQGTRFRTQNFCTATASLLIFCPMGQACGLAVEVLLREDEIAAEFESAFSRRYLDEKFFYWLPSSVNAWVELTRSTEYRNSNRALQVLAGNAPALAKRWTEIDALCSLGCGEGSKDRILLEAFKTTTKSLAYVAADFSQALLELALLGAEPVTRARRGVKFDVSRDDHLRGLRHNGVACIYAVLGNTLGAFDPQHFPARLREIMASGDRALFDGEIFDDETMRGYDNPTNRRFAFAPLAGLGLTEQDGELRFEARRGRAGIHEVAKYFVARRDLDIRLGSNTITLRADEKLRMSSSIKYDEDTFYRLVEGAGFQLELAAKSADGKFMLAAVRPR